MSLELEKNNLNFSGILGLNETFDEIQDYVNQLDDVYVNKIFNTTYKTFDYETKLDNRVNDVPGFTYYLENTTIGESAGLFVGTDKPGFASFLMQILNVVGGVSVSNSISVDSGALNIVSELGSVNSGSAIKIEPENIIVIIYDNSNSLTIDITPSTIAVTGLNTYADNAAALIGGLTENMLYKTSTGDLKIVY